MMKLSRFSLFCLIALALQLAGCAQAPTPMVITVVVPATAIPATGSTTAPTTGLPPTATLADVATLTNTVPPTPAPPTATVGPQCTIKQNVNFRYGPGKAYDPPIDALTAGTVVLPQSYQAQGFPGGNWVQVINPGNQKTGWVSAGTDFITCTIDLTSLPTSIAPPTPTPSAPIITNSQPQGDFTGFVGKLHFSNTFLVSLEVYQKGGKKDGDNIQQVTFTISDPDGTVRVQKEQNAPYCVFGGGSTCAAWPRQDGKYAWTSNGPLVKDGDKYTINIDVEAKDGSNANWHFDTTINLP